MSESLLPYFDQELRAIRQEAAAFAEAFPRAAGRLRIAPEAVDDPFVARLLDGVAFLAARVQHRLDDELPEFSDALLEMLAPGLLAPMPSMTTLRLSPGRQPLPGPATIPRGLVVDTDPVEGGRGPVRFRTTQEVTLWPVAIEAARLSGLPFPAPANPRAGGAAMACLRITLRTPGPELPFSALGLDRLRLHLTGVGVTPAALHELLATATLSVALADGPQDPRPTILGPEAIRLAGFEDEEAALPWPRRAFAGHRLLAEYFAFPDKFLYLDLDGLEARTLVQGSDRLEVFVYLSRALPALERAVSAENLALHCTPAVNLFPQRCEPIGLDGTRAEWPVLPDARRPGALEVITVEEVRESRADGSRRPVLPFHRLGRRDAEGAAEGAAPPMHYVAARRPAAAPLGGTQTVLLLRDPAFDPMRPADGTLHVEALCCNRDLPAMLPFRAGQPRLTVAPGTKAVEAEALTAPTHTLRPGLRDRSAWKLLSHLALNHLSVAGGEEGALALREILRLHDLRDSPESRAALQALLAVESGPGVARLPGGRPGAMVQGLDVRLTFDPQAWQAGGLFLLAAVIERFLALQVSVNAFVRTSVALRGREGLAARFAPRSGTRFLL